MLAEILESIAAVNFVIKKWERTVEEEKKEPLREVSVQASQSSFFNQIKAAFWSLSKYFISVEEPRAVDQLSFEDLMHCYKLQRAVEIFSKQFLKLKYDEAAQSDPDYHGLPYVMGYALYSGEQLRLAGLEPPSSTWEPPAVRGR